MTCKLCPKKLRADNTLGYCRTHRSQSPIKKAYKLSWNETNRDKLSSYWRQYGAKNRKTLSEKWKASRKSDIQFQLRHALRTRMSRAVARNTKAGSAVSELGCSILELKQHLENQFKPGMTWSNWGPRGWHIDHIKPLSSFDLTNPEQFKIACHYTNLQPLWAEENIRKHARIVSQECSSKKAS